MSTTTTTAPTTTLKDLPRPQVVAHEVPRRRKAWIDWVTTVDHKKIGIMYMVTAFVFFLVGGIEALLIRIQLGAPDNTFLTPEKYNQLFTMHGTTMIFLFVVPMMAGLGNYFVPLMIGARDMAFPKLNALSFWLLLAGGVVFYGSLFFNPPECGWTCYAPLSEHAYTPTGGTGAWIYLIHLTGLSSLIGSINFYVRASLEPDQMIPTVIKVVARLDPNLPVESPKTMLRQINDNVFLDRMISVLSAAFAGLATLLAAVGLYGVLAYTVAQRTREIGLRMALGAAPERVRAMVLRQVIWMTLIGGVVGLATAAALGRLAESMLFELKGRDPLVLGGAAIALTCVALAAGFIPAHRASKIDPMRALRYE